MFTVSSGFPAKHFPGVHINTYRPGKSAHLQGVWLLKNSHFQAGYSPAIEAGALLGFLLSKVFSLPA